MSPEVCPICNKEVAELKQHIKLVHGKIMDNSWPKKDQDQYVSENGNSTAKPVDCITDQESQDDSMDVSEGDFFLNIFKDNEYVLAADV